MAIMEDVDAGQRAGHYQLFRFCQATRLPYLNGQVPIENQNYLQQQHVDHKIAEALLKKGTINAYRTRTGESRATKAVESLAVVGRRVASHESGFHQSSRGLALSAWSSRPFISTRKVESCYVALCFWGRWS